MTVSPFPGAPLLASLTGRVAAARRRFFIRHPERRYRLRQPVVSVGNLALGGAGKTPIVAHVARLLLDAGERPAILSRGYAREDQPPGVVVVSDGRGIRADLPRAGDEPLMLARMLPEAGVFVAADRGLAGALAERRFGATVHVLDDGFQHLGLDRDVELVIVSPEDEEDRVAPAGRLREPLETLALADALLVSGASVLDARAMAARWQVPRAFAVTRTPAVPRLVEPWGSAPRLSRPAPVVAVAGVARPARFFDEVARAGWTIVDRLAFPDHHRFTAGDVERIAARLKASRASLVLTTEKDVMRLLPFRPLPVPIAWVPLAAAVEPAEDFGAWLRWRVIEARQAGLDAPR